MPNTVNGNSGPVNISGGVVLALGAAILPVSAVGACITLKAIR